MHFQIIVFGKLFAHVGRIDTIDPRNVVRNISRDWEYVEFSRISSILEIISDTEQLNNGESLKCHIIDLYFQAICFKSDTNLKDLKHSLK